jgi:sugar lactone lactonase YvrE
MNIVTLSSSQCGLGESPLWHSVRESFFWVDVNAGVLYELHASTQQVTKWNVGKAVSLVQEADGNNVILAVKGGVIAFCLESGEQKRIADLDDSIANNRCNDGASDSAGRLWVGTMDMGCKAGAGSLYRISGGAGIKKMIGNLTIPNGLVWSLGNERMYFIDTPQRAVVSYFFSESTGDIYYEGVAVYIPAAMGMPDGMAIDAEGMLWIALYGGGAITRWDPLNGHLLEIIKLPALNITNCAFVGNDLSDLMVTSARQNMTDAELKEFPESGNVFIIYNLPVKGVKINRPAFPAGK